ncbi:hypothetical protein U6N30_04510 [Blastococcus brunescens]|uniref:Uncharacterized protein n=1 Tax=Blastococcus brunescens TaxID=1564165 RepID=A0ABZ1B5K3_9ACTN|nr:hypothetical protein [Blastococcus sp. BMG 8361]WRL64981.1 hypothetical protein U6N30_04510 [Blastococcus sp. BMG 8361]
MLHDLHAFSADDVPPFRLPGSLRVDQVSDRQLQGGAVGQQLVEVGLREAGGLLCLVLRVDDPAGMPAADVQTRSGFILTESASSSQVGACRCVRPPRRSISSPSATVTKSSNSCGMLTRKPSTCNTPGASCMEVARSTISAKRTATW